MKITLINPYDFTGPGIRSLAAVLKAKGHEVQNIFLMQDTRFLIHSQKGFSSNRVILDEILKNCRDSNLVGISLMTSAFFLAADITRHIKEKLNMPVIWGGIHPTIRPDECLEYVDMVCIGEGEVPLSNLIDRMQKNSNYLNIEGIWYKNNGSIIKNRLPPLIQDLDTLPIDTYEFEGDKILKGERLVPVDYETVAELLDTQIMVFFSRGCPYRCAFCCNNILNNIYKGQKVVRHKSPRLVVEEIRQILSKFNRINRIFFGDDSFIVMPVKDLAEFSQLYKKHINLPFSCQVTAPSVTKEKIDLLVEAGLNDVRMGLQSASPSTLKLYNRPITAEMVKKASQVISDCLGQGQILSYDLILDNPYETKENLLETLKFLIDLPRPYSLRFFSLQLYPGTELYNRVISEKGSTKNFRDAYKGSYRSAGGSYLNFLFYVMKLIGLKRFPISIGRVMLNRNIVFFMDNPVMNLTMKGLRNLRSFWRYFLKLRIKSLSREAPPEIKKSHTNL